jgi:PAS domain S-box-containing protein
LIFLLDEDGRQARLIEQINLRDLPAGLPGTVNLEHENRRWDFQHVLETKTSQVVEDLEERFGRLPAGAWTDDWTRRALVLPLAKAGAQELPAGFLVAGISPRLVFDDEYRGFLELVAGHIATAIANARAHEAERKRIEALAELDRAKTAFFNNVSHEFRTPLTLLLGPLEDELADSANDIPAQRRERLAIAHRNTLRLIKLVNSLLDFSRIEAGRLQASYEPTDLAAVTADLASVFRSAIERAGLRLRVECPPLPEPLVVDREMWEKIVLNLLSNAFKFTFEGEIAVCLRWTGAGAELSVSDTGTGIAPEELPKLFTRFHRIRGARGRTHEGTGIGLALVQELVRLHGGTIQAHSELGRGSTFTVSLPAGSAHLPAEHLAARRALASTAVDAITYVEEALRWLPDAPPGLEAGRGLGAAGPRPDDGAALPPGPAARVLVVDDNADMRAYLARLLGQWWTVELAENGARALALAQEHPPDLVLSDVMMPGLDGFELLRALRAGPRTRAVPVVLLSARAGEEAQVEGLEAGADDYLVKPFSAQELVARVRAHLEMARLRRELLEQSQAQLGRLRLLTDAFPALIAYVDREHRYQFNNRAYLEWFGQDPEALRGQPLRAVLGEEAYAAILPYVSAALGGQRVSFEAEVPYQHGGPRPVHATYVPHAGPAGEVLGFYSLVSDIAERKQAERERVEYARRLEERVLERTTALQAAVLALQAEVGERQRAAEALELSRAELRRLSAYLQKAREEERRSMAREIHDELGQRLTGLKMDVSALQKLLPDEPRLRERARDIVREVNVTIELVRNLATELRPAILDDFGLPAAIEWQLHEFARRSGIRSRLAALADTVALDSDGCTAVFRIFQETLTNVARHSGASEVEVRLEERDGHLVLEVRDNGRGIAREALSGGKSLGLLGMRERAHLLGGEIAVTGAPGQGTAVQVKIPLPAA